MRRFQYVVALVALAVGVASSGCSVDFIGDNAFACEGEGIQSTCLDGYRCNFGRCVVQSAYVQPDTGGPQKDVVDVVQDVPPDIQPDIPLDVPDIQPAPERGDPCELDDECEPGRTGLVCSDEKVCCDSKCTQECRTCLNTGDDLGVCTPRPSGTACTVDGAGDSSCNACDETGACQPQQGERCGRCQECTTEGGAGVCSTVTAGEDPFGDCGDNPLCGGACGTGGQCDIAAATAQDGTACETCRDCNLGFCVPRLAGEPDTACGDEACGGVCAEGGLCTTEFLEPDTVCGTCHTCNAEGRCLSVREGTPDPNCVEENVCGMTGLCDALGTCAIRAVAFECADPTCVETTRTTWACDDGETCVPAEESCVPYTCDSVRAECRTACHSNAPCADGYYCAGGVCQGTGQPGDPCAQNVQCESGFCVDGVCCGSACAGACEVCDGVPGVAEAGTCAIPVGANPLRDRSGTQDGERDCDGQVDSCDGVCVDAGDGVGACDYGVTAEDSCGTCKWCSPEANGFCVNRPSTPPYFDDCDGDEVCGGYCEAGACRFLKNVGDACGDGPCDVCVGDRTCGLAAAGTDPKGLCPGDQECGGGCTAEGTCGSFVDDDTQCGSEGTPCFWCQSGNCVLIAREDTPSDLCGGGDDLCRARCTAAGSCGPAVPAGAPCARVCHRCDGSGQCAFAFDDPLGEPADECPGDLACGTHCDADVAACGAPKPEDTVCVIGTFESGQSAGDGCSACQEFTAGDVRCLPRTTTPTGVCVRDGGHPSCTGSCGSFGVCEWPGQEEPCGECHRCNGDGLCQQAAGDLVSGEDCTPDDPLCRGECLGGTCVYAQSDQDICGSPGTVCRWCQTGMCEFIENGADPLGQCNPVDHPVCGETCNGAGACTPAPGPSDPDGPIACGTQGTQTEACHWCDEGACAPIGQTLDDIIPDPFDSCQADQVCSAGECSLCGNGVREVGEVCDPNDPDHPCEGVCTSPDPCVLAVAFDCRCTEVPVVEPDDGSDGCCPPLTERGLDPDCVRWETPLQLNPDPFQPFTFTQIPAIDPTTGTLYIGGRDDTSPTPRPRIFAVAPSGEILWDVSTASDPTFASVATSSPVLVEGKIYFGRSTWLVSVDLATRETAEIINLNALIKEPPVVSRSGLLIVGTQDGRIRGVNPFTAQVEWSYATGSDFLTGPGTQSGYYVYWGAGETLHVVNTNDPPTTTGSSPCFSPPPPAVLSSGGVGLGTRIGDAGSGSLYLADDAGVVYVLFAAGTASVGCTALNTHDTLGGAVDAMPVTLSDGSVILGGHDPNLNPDPDVGLYSLTSNLTDVVWTEALGKHVRFTPVIGKGPEGELVYVALRQTTGVRILAIQPGLGGATQGLVWGHEYEVPGDPTAYVSGALVMGTDGTVYFRTSDGSLNAIVTNSTDGLSNRGWPKRHGDYGNTGNAP